MDGACLWGSVLLACPSNGIIHAFHICFFFSLSSLYTFGSIEETFQCQMQVSICPYDCSNFQFKAVTILIRHITMLYLMILIISSTAPTFLPVTSKGLKFIALDDPIEGSP